MINLEKYYVPFFVNGQWYWLMPAEHGPPMHKPSKKDILAGPFPDRERATVLANETLAKYKGG